jgi:uncharacterized repeat protein (TIGR03806 family)
MKFSNTSRPLLVTAKRWCILAALLTVAACSKSSAPVNFIAEGKPEKLSDWHLMQAADARLTLNTGVEAYDLNTALFTDYAHKLRTIWMPKGSSARYDPDKAFDFPVGTIISKTFYYPRVAGAARDSKAVLVSEGTAQDYDGERLNLDKVRLMETRLLVRRSDGWIALPYVWNAEQTEATLMRTGEQIPIELTEMDANANAKPATRPLTYVVPNVNQCASCHVADVKSRQFAPLGPKARHLNLERSYGGVTENQLAHLARIGYLSGAPQPAEAPRNAAWGDKKADLNSRARAYLDINCAHCHNDKGAANTTALHLNIGAPANRHLGICKPPVAAGAGTGNRPFGIMPGKPDDSIMLYRLSTAETGVMMPELGRGSVHKEGAELIRQWIAAMNETCDTATKD